MFKNLLICSINYLMSFGVLFMNSFPLQVIFPFGSNSKVLFFLLSTSGLVSENKIFFRSGLMSWVNKLLIVLGKMLISSLVNRLNVIKYNVHRLNDATAFNADDKFLFF
jgi:hypothetical protein